MRDLMNILTENEHLHTLSEGIRKAVTELLESIDAEGEDEEVRHCIAMLNNALASQNFSSMCKTSHDVCDRLAAWLTDNTEEVFEEMPNVDNARATLYDTLDAVGA